MDLTPFSHAETRLAAAELIREGDAAWASHARRRQRWSPAAARELVKLTQP